MWKIKHTGKFKNNKDSSNKILIHTNSRTEEKNEVRLENIIGEKILFFRYCKDVWKIYGRDRFVCNYKVTVFSS